MAGVPISKQSLGFQPVTSLAKIPEQEGARAFPVRLDFALGATLELDMGVFFAERQISAIKTIYIDNSAQASALDITMLDSGQRVTVAPYSQAYVAVLASQNPRIQFQFAGGSAIIPIQLLNFEIPPTTWTVLGGTTISITGIVETEEQATTAIDTSGTFTTGGVSQQIIPATTQAQSVEKYVANPHTTDSLWINITGGAATVSGAGSIEIPAGQGWSGKVLNQVNGISATTGRPYTAGYR